VYELALKDDIIIVTYGDMIRVPGSHPEYTLEKAKAKGAEVKIVYSSIDALQIAKQNPNKKVVFLGIGFETTAPATAIAIIEAEKLNIDNFYIISMHKIVEPVMRALLEDKELNIDGFICPGHVAVIIGEDGFSFLEKYNSIGVIAGFEPGNIAKALVEIIHNKETSDYALKNVYRELVAKKEI
jgi:hydrogenase expression/formation protein HypD